MENDTRLIIELFSILDTHAPNEFAVGESNGFKIINRPVKFLREATGLGSDITKAVRCELKNGNLKIFTFFTASAGSSKDHQEHAGKVIEIAKKYLEPINFPGTPQVTLEEYAGYTSAEGILVDEGVLAGNIIFTFEGVESLHLPRIADLIAALHHREAQYYIDGVGVVSETQAIEHFGNKVDGWSVIVQTPLTTTYS